jgi:hypothetical protein
MKVPQISIFVENRKGRLASVARLLAQGGVNLIALSLADTADFGILRLIADDPDRAQRLLRDQGFTVVETDVIAIEVEDRPGGLADLLEVLDGAGVNIEYMYAFSELRTGRAPLIFRFEDPERAIQVLNQSGIPVLSKVELFGHD